MSRVFFALCASLLVFVSSASALDLTKDVKWIKFTGWDHSLVSTVGQTLNDVYEDVDVTATVNGDFTLPTTTIAGGKGLASQNRVVGSQTFDFTFSKPLALVVRYQSTDDQEMFDVLAPDILTHTHTLGADPSIVTIPGGVQVMGNGRTMAADGAARGYFELGETNHLAITHHALVPNKYEGFRIGVILNPAPVPEPTSAYLGLLGAVVLWGKMRRFRLAK
ncbi:MAG: hypothetical protein KDA60_11050 [Planctomycetales bacterium]|nr:hypothetical protein [Planctomycetales bacterium]